jgi:hypothetical protein
MWTPRRFVENVTRAAQMTVSDAGVGNHHVFVHTLLGRREAFYTRGEGWPAELYSTPEAMRQFGFMFPPSCAAGSDPFRMTLHCDSYSAYRPRRVGR